MQATKMVTPAVKMVPAALHRWAKFVIQFALRIRKGQLRQPENRLPSEAKTHAGASLVA